MEDLGLEAGISDLEFRIFDSGPETDRVKRIECDFIFPEAAAITYEGSEFVYQKGERFRLFYSNRFQPALLNRKLERQGFRILDRYLTGSGEEGVWVVKKQGPG
jgi:hypothetical protein